MLSVLHISTFDNVGGSARQAYRLHTGLRRLGVRSRMLVGRQATDDEDVNLIGDRILWLLDRACGKLTDRLDLQYLFYPSSFTLMRRRWFREADVVQIHNTHGAYFSHTALPFISKRRPVIWRLSDMWSMTGHCVYSYGCDRWLSGCGRCPILGDYPRLSSDRTALLWRVKQSLYARSDLTIAAPSRWIAGVASRSPLLGRFPIVVIPSGVDLEVFRPVAKQAARQVLGLRGDVEVILFAAQLLSEDRKGGSLLRAALARLPADRRNDVELLVMGKDSGSRAPLDSVRVHSLGEIRDDRLMATIYSAADVFALPTLADNLPNGIIESMACGTPVVSFDIGGVPELVRHMETGYLARPGDAVDFGRGLTLLLEDDELRRTLGERGLEVARLEYSQELLARRYVELYREAIAARAERGVA